MFGPNLKKSTRTSALETLELIYHVTVYNIRKSHRNALIGLGMEIVQAIIFIGVFYVMFSFFGLRGMAIRGDFTLYLMSGIFLFTTHIKAIMAVFSAESTTSAIMKHARMNAIITIAASALKALYLQVLAMVVILLTVHVIINPIEIYDPAGAMGMLFAAWYSGIGIGMIFYAAKPWAPEFIKIFNQLYSRLNMIASGKMFVANTMPGFLLLYFTWNPLFHCIDQARGFIFINYNPHNSSLSYPFIVATICIIIGLLGVQYTRKYESMSWGAGR